MCGVSEIAESAGVCAKKWHSKGAEMGRLQYYVMPVLRNSACPSSEIPHEKGPALQHRRAEDLVWRTVAQPTCTTSRHGI